MPLFLSFHLPVRAAIIMSELIFVGGEKGGVGKSMCAKTLCQFHFDRGIPFTLVELDRSNPDCIRCYKDGSAKLGILSEGEKYEDAGNILFNAALEQRTIANLPAQVLPALKQWIANNSIFELAEEAGVGLYHLHVSDAGFDSLSLFVRYVKTFDTQLHHVFVKNLGRADDWSPLSEDTELQTLISEHQIPVIELPKFVGNRDRNLLDQLSLSFGKGREYEGFDVISRQRIKTYLKNAYKAFDQLLFLQPPPKFEHQIVPFQRPGKRQEEKA